MTRNNTRDETVYIRLGPDRGRETTKDCEEAKALAVINEDLGLKHILATDCQHCIRSMCTTEIIGQGRSL